MVLMNLFGSEDCSCCGVDVCLISCAVAINLKDHGERGWEAANSESRNQTYSPGSLCAGDCAFRGTPAYSEIFLNYSVRDTDSLAWSRSRRYPRTRRDTCGCKRYAKESHSGLPTRSGARSSPMQPQGLVRLTAGGDHLHDRHVFGITFAVAANRLKVRYHFE